MPLKTQLDEPPTINLTPMVDVAFQLILFFMVATKFTELERKIGLRVPEVAAVSALTPAPEKRVVNVHQDGHITLDQQAVSLEQLTQRLSEARSQYRDVGVLIRGDAGVRYQHVAAVLAACKQAGVMELGISVRLASQRSSSARGR
ncbi:MAG: biopolymer transporter ExbD [Planctomycetes bacterium RBG_16_64_10]|nr:MAG: biopolymer transporter ExbD [Planctomycetes bacterium RBG_16_64_10]